MPLYASNFTANSLSGAVRVSGGTANIRLIVEPFAFEGNKQFNLKLRKDSISGSIIATSSNITIYDTSVVSNVTANLAAVGEGNLISFTITTSNVPNNSNVYFSLLNVAGNVDSSDFLFNGFTANTGRVTIINNSASFVLKANADFSVKDEEGETFKLQLRTNSPFGNIVYTTANVVITDTSSNLPPANGQAEYTVAGTYSWIAPLRVSNVSVVAIGGGGGGYSGPPGNPSTLGGGGGGLGWKNNIPVISGNPYTVVVGNGGRGGDYAYPGSTTFRIGGNGNTSYFIDISTVAGYGGSGGGSGISPFLTGGYGGGYVGDGGGNGGSGAQDSYATGGGGGAGGYSGDGGPGGGSPSYSTRNGGLGNGGGGAGGNAGHPMYEGGGGGGVHLYGQGNSGVRLETITAPQPGWPNSNGTGGGGGSGGNNGGNGSNPPVAINVGGTFGGGGGSGFKYPEGAGAGGAVRIIWGGGRYFPNVMTGNVY